MAYTLGNSWPDKLIPSTSIPTLIATAIGLGLLAGSLALLPWSLLLTLLFAAVGLPVLLRWPWLVWLGIAVILPVSSGVKFGPLSLTEVALAVAALLWFADGVRRRSLPLGGTGLVAGPLVYGAALYLATLQATDLGEAAAEVIKWLEFTAVILLVRSTLPAERRHWLAIALLLGGVGQAVLGLYQFIFRLGPDWFIILERFMRASGSFGQPNPYGGYLGLTLPVAVSLALWAWAAWGQDGFAARGNFFRQAGWAVAYTSAAGLSAAGLLASWSRGAWIGAALALAVVSVVRSRRSAALGGFVALGGLVAGLIGAVQPGMIPPSIAQRVQDIPAYLGLTDVLSQPVTDENFAIIERLAHWVAALRMWEGSPWLGVGPGNYAVVYPSVRLPRWEEPLGHAHNIYLNVLAESGVVGMVAFLLFWGAMGWWVIRHLCRQTGWNQALTIGVLGVLVHLAVHSFFDNLFVQGMYIHLALWLGVVDQVDSNKTRTYAEHPCAGCIPITFPGRTNLRKGGPAVWRKS